MNPDAATATLVTAPAPGGIAVIVLTGRRAPGILSQVFRPRGRAPEPGRLSLGWIAPPDREDEVLDEAVVAIAQPAAGAPPVVEMSIHGGPRAAREVLALLSRCGAEVAPETGVDPALAAPAEGMGNPAVTAEVLSALRRAHTPLAAAAVAAQWWGGLSALACQALAAQGSGGDGATVADRKAFVARLRSAAGAGQTMRRLLDPAEVVIAGPPNVGKSALTNALVGRDVSIVSETPGTTRDWVRHLAEADGVPVWLTDTAGLREAPPAAPPGVRDIEAEAVRRAWQRVESADLVLCMTAGAVGQSGPLILRLRACPNVLNVSGKCDVLPPAPGADLAVSARTGAGVADLRRQIRRRLGLDRFDPYAPAAFTERQQRLLISAAEGIEHGACAGVRLALKELLAGRPSREGP